MRARSWRDQANLTAGALGKKKLRRIQFQTTCGVGDSFDPQITLRTGCPHTPHWDFGNGDTATGTNITYSSYADAGPHTVTLTIPNIGYWLTEIDVYDDKIVGDFFEAIKGCLSLTKIVMGENTGVTSDLSTIAHLTQMLRLDLREHQTGIVGDIASLANMTGMLKLYIAGCGVHGDIASLAGMTNMTYLDLHQNPYNGGVVGDLADISGLTKLTYLSFGGSVGVTGELADLAAMTALNACLLYSIDISGSFADIPNLDSLGYFWGTNLLEPGDISGLPWMEYMRLGGSWNQAEVDALLAQIYADRALYTRTGYGARHYLNNSSHAAPSGVYQDATPPTTGLEYIYKLANDPDAEGFKQWTFVYNGGQAP
jgi:hypothetical protein